MVGGKTRLEMYRDVLKGYNLIPYTTEGGEKITIVTGHQVYVKADDADGQQYIVSGVDLIPVEHGVPDTRMTVKLRAEDTCERVRVFTTREVWNRDQDAWERGPGDFGGRGTGAGKLCDSERLPARYKMGAERRWAPVSAHDGCCGGLR